jgi:hypothetical protein
MNVPRETIANVLTSLLRGINAHVALGAARFPAGNINRKGGTWSKQSPVSAPTMFIIHVGERATQASTIGLTKWIVDFYLEIFAPTDESSSAIADTLVNAILDAIDATLQSVPPGERQTLGGIVTNCWIEGDIIIGTAQLTNQLMMLVPVRVQTGT